jgi:hypothetical protein
MARTTIDLDRTVLEELRERARCERKSMGQVASELLALALASPPAERPRPEFWWPSQRGGPLVDIDDKDALWEVLDAEE